MTPGQLVDAMLLLLPKHLHLDIHAGNHRNLTFVIREFVRKDDDKVGAVEHVSFSYAYAPDDLRFLRVLPEDVAKNLLYAACTAMSEEKRKPEHDQELTPAGGASGDPS